MGTRFEINIFGEGEVLVFEGQSPTQEPSAETVGLFVGDTAKETNTHLAIVAISQAAAAFKNSLTNEGEQNILDRQTVRDPIDPVFQVSNDLVDATEAHIWLAYRSDVLTSSKSHMVNVAIETLTRHYKKAVGVGTPTIPNYGIPTGVITQAAGTYISAATVDLGGTDIWKRGTKIDIAGTTDAVFGANITLKKDMVLYEVGLLLAEFLKGWSQSTLRNVRHPSNPLITSVGLVAGNGGLTVSFDSLVVTPAP